MRRPTCVGPRLATVDGDAGRWGCDCLAPRPLAVSLVRRIAGCRDLDVLLRLLVAVEHAAIHCRVDDDETTALRAVHARRHRQLLALERSASPAGRSVTMLVRGAS